MINHMPEATSGKLLKSAFLEGGMSFHVAEPSLRLVVRLRSKQKIFVGYCPAPETESPTAGESRQETILAYFEGYRTLLFAPAVAFSLSNSVSCHIWGQGRAFGVKIPDKVICYSLYRYVKVSVFSLLCI